MIQWSFVLIVCHKLICSLFAVINISYSLNCLTNTPNENYQLNEIFLVFLSSLTFNLQLALMLVKTSKPSYDLHTQRQSLWMIYTLGIISLHISLQKSPPFFWKVQRKSMQDTLLCHVKGLPVSISKTVHVCTGWAHIQCVITHWQLRSKWVFWDSLLWMGTGSSVTKLSSVRS